VSVSDFTKFVLLGETEIGSAEEQLIKGYPNPIE
jgi:hypothetical protein